MNAKSNPGAFPAFPFGGNVLENLELMSKAWGAGLAQVPGFSSPMSMAQAIPSMMVPTLDVAELDKRITDLRAVEQWLALNANMLRASIQALEVQRNTIATLQTIGATMMNAPQAAAAGMAAAMPPPAAAAAASSGGAASDAGTSRRARKAAAADAPASNFAEMPLNPAAWWSNLQDQFTRIATAAAGDPKAPGAGAATPGAEADKADKDRTGAAKAAAPKDDNRPAARKPPTRRTS